MKKQIKAIARAILQPGPRPEIAALKHKLAEAIELQRITDEMACSGTNIMKAAR